MVQFPRITGFMHHAAASLLLCSALSSCAWFIPEEKSAPRYNTVVGEPHRPALNPASGVAPASDAQMPLTPVASVQPVSADYAYPPVSPETQARAAVIANELPPPTVATPELTRRVPIENAGGAVSAQNDYPPLSTVPPSPAATDREDAARLARVRMQLEDERTAANAQHSKLNGDAAAEPSLSHDNSVSQTAPAPEPVTIAPIPAPPIAPYTNSPHSSLPLPPPPLAGGYGNRYTPVANGLPESTGSVIAAPPVMVAGAGSPGQEPIILHPPQSATVNSIPQPMPSTVYNEARAEAAEQPMLPASSGGFNPFDTSTGSNVGYTDSATGNSGYLPPSRYAGRRSY